MVNDLSNLKYSRLQSKKGIIKVIVSYCKLLLLPFCRIGLKVFSLYYKVTRNSFKFHQSS